MGVLDQILPGGAPWQQPDWKGWGSQLRGPPMKLLSKIFNFFLFFFFFEFSKM